MLSAFVQSCSTKVYISVTIAGVIMSRSMLGIGIRRQANCFGCFGCFGVFLVNASQCSYNCLNLKILKFSIDMKFSNGLLLREVFAAVTSVALINVVTAQESKIIWEAYNDHRPGEFIHENVSDWDIRAEGEGGALRDFATGDELDAEVLVEVVGNPQDFGANEPPVADSPAAEFFGEFIDLAADGLPGVQAGANELTL
ncbi:MAG: hypothetical protein O3C21_15530, partial [Verrucomicrobia bacterium]|nr:hypothetical protein [Verrucomicrobiota bacterium]